MRKRGEVAVNGRWRKRGGEREGRGIDKERGFLNIPDSYYHLRFLLSPLEEWVDKD